MLTLHFSAKTKTNRLISELPKKALHLDGRSKNLQNIDTIDHQCILQKTSKTRGSPFSSHNQEQYPD